MGLTLEGDELLMGSLLDLFFFSFRLIRLFFFNSYLILVLGFYRIDNMGVIMVDQASAYRQNRDSDQFSRSSILCNLQQSTSNNLHP